MNVNDLISRPLRERHADLFGTDTPITVESLRDLDDLLCRLPYRVEDGRREYYLDRDCHWSEYGLTRIIRGIRFLTEDTQDVQLLGEEMHTASDTAGMNHEVSDELRYYCGWLHDGASMTTARLHEADRHLRRCEYIIRGGAPFYQVGPMWLSERRATALLAEIRSITDFEPLGALHLAGREKVVRNE
ncbi:hypothetical protein [Candidatus Corynebacterium faecigallinarum]|uniref:hypothetical protein n=1 Tax=Candidatus Corynebacterium faecigallinarum TaxID=2838528 RepID=UPI003FD48AE1